MPADPESVNFLSPWKACEECPNTAVMARWLQYGVNPFHMAQGEGRLLLAAREFMLGETLPMLTLVPQVLLASPTPMRAAYLCEPTHHSHLQGPCMSFAEAGHHLLLELASTFGYAYPKWVPLVTSTARSEGKCTHELPPEGRLVPCRTAMGTPCQARWSC